LGNGLGRGISALDGIDSVVGQEGIAAVVGVDVELEVIRLEGISGDRGKEDGQRDQERNEELHVVEK
jgi:hypothetical protein